MRSGDAPPRAAGRRLAASPSRCPFRPSRRCAPRLLKPPVDVLNATCRDVSCGGKPAVAGVRRGRRRHDKQREFSCGRGPFTAAGRHRHRQYPLQGADVRLPPARWSPAPSAPRPASPDGLTHDAEELTAAALGALTDCVRKAERAPVAVGLTGMAETGVPLDRHGVPIGPSAGLVRPRPRRRTPSGCGAPTVRRMLHARTGVLPSAKVPLASWCWLRQHHPERLSRMRQWAGAADLVARALTGRVGTDATFAQRSMAWEHGSGNGHGQGRWNADLLAEAGLTPAQMPHVHPPGHPVGTVRRDVARKSRPACRSPCRRRRARPPRGRLGSRSAQHRQSGRLDGDRRGRAHRLGHAPRPVRCGCRRHVVGKTRGRRTLGHPGRDGEFGGARGVVLRPLPRTPRCTRPT